MMMMFIVQALLAATTIGGTLADQLDIHLTDHNKNETDTRFCSAETASFGSTYLFWSMQAIVVNAFPLNGCQPVRPPPFLRNDSRAWVALVARDRSLSGGCPFDRKILNAQTAGFDAVLVYNYEDKVLVMQPSDSGSHVRIPAAMVTNSCGVNLRTVCAYSVSGDRYSLSFEIPFPFDFHVYVISFAVIIGVCLLLSLLVWGIKLYRDWRRSRRNRLPRSSLKKLKVKKFEKGTDPYDCCAICLEDFESGERLRILPCNHAYHTKCVDQWLLKTRSTCPVCKRRVFPRSPDSDDEVDPDLADAASTTVAPSTGESVGPGAAAASAGPSSVVGAASGAASPETASLQDERTPLLHGATAAAATTGSTSALTASSAVALGGDGTFDNAALTADDSSSSAADDGTDDAESVVTAAAAGVGEVSVEVFVHRCQEETAAKHAVVPAEV